VRANVVQAWRADRLTGLVSAMQAAGSGRARRLNVVVIASLIQPTQKSRLIARQNGEA
jgi:hypothetical protein